MLAWVISQIFTVVEYGLLGASYLAKNRKAVVLLDIASMACGIIAFILLGADLGMAMSVIVLLANFYYLWEEANSSRTSSKVSASKYDMLRTLVLVVVLVGIAVVTYWTYDGPLSLLSVAATTLYEISIWQKSTKMYKFLGIPVALCWMLYNGFVLSPFGVLSEFVMFSTSIVGYVRELKGEKSKKAKKAGGAKKTSNRKTARK